MNFTVNESDILNIDNKWYFWDEERINKIGPYKTKEECIQALKDYVQFLFCDL